MRLVQLGNVVGTSNCSFNIYYNTISNNTIASIYMGQNTTLATNVPFSQIASGNLIVSVPDEATSIILDDACANGCPTNTILLSNIIGFTTVWKTTTSNETISLPYLSDGTYSGTINWGDSTSSVNSYANRTHTYATPGTYNVTIYGTTTGWNFSLSNPLSASKLQKVLQWGFLKLGSDVGGYFQSCTSLTMDSVTDILNLDGITDLSNMFSDCQKIVTINNITSWDVSNVTNMYGMFTNCFYFNQSLNGWNVGNVVNMSQMFSNCVRFNESISRWNVSSVQNMNGMFFGTSSFNQPLSNWERTTPDYSTLGNVTDMSSMFSAAIKFNYSIENWNVFNVQNMSSMFSQAVLFNKPLGQWNVSNVTEMDGMFATATNFNQDLSSWCVPNIPSEPTNFDLNANSWTLPRPTWGTCSETAQLFISVWKTTNYNETVTLPYLTGGTYSGIIDWGDGTTSVNSYSNRNHIYSIPGDYTIKISGNKIGLNFRQREKYSDNPQIRKILQWGNLQLIDDLRFGGYFAGCINLTLDTVSDVLSLAGITNLESMFAGCRSISIARNMGSWDVSSVTNMGFMFDGAKLFNTDISSWNVSNVINMSFMFSTTDVFNQNLNNWDVSNVQSMNAMFYNTKVFNQPLSAWNVSNVIDMSLMFYSAITFNQPLSNWERTTPDYSTLGNVTNMTTMFENAISFNSDITNWNTSNVISMREMFQNAISFNQPIGNWNVSSVGDMSNMFYSAITFNQPLSNWERTSPSFSTLSNVYTMAGMFRYAERFNQPIGNWNLSGIGLGFPTENPDSGDLSYMFDGATNFNQPLSNWERTSPNVSTLGNARYMIGMFRNVPNFNYSINNWNVQNVRDMSRMFENATSFNQPLNLWNIQSIGVGGNLQTGLFCFMCGKSSLNYSYQNYDSLLNGWSTNVGGYLSVIANFGSIKYSAAGAAARFALLQRNWQITDGGQI